MNSTNINNHSSENNIFSNGNSYQTEKPDLKKWVFLFLSNWRWFAAFLILGLAIAFFVNKFTAPVYKIGASVLVKSNDQSNMPEEMAMMSGFSSPDMKNFENQAILLKTESQILRTLDQLDFNVSYYTKGKFTVPAYNFRNVMKTINTSIYSKQQYQKKEFYQENSIRVILDPDHDQVLDVVFNLALNSNGQLQLEAKAEDAVVHSFSYNKDIGNLPSFAINEEVRLGQLIEGDYYSFLIEADETDLNELLVDNELSFVIRDNKRLVKDFEKINVAFAPKGASIANLSLTGTCLNKSKLFLNKLMEVWIQNNLDQKNQIANNTISFIDQQLYGLSDTLGRMGAKLQKFRTSNNVVKPTVQVEAAYQKIQELDSETSKLQMQASYFERLQGYLNKREDYDKLISPASVGIEQSVLGEYIAQLAEVRAALFQYKGKEKLNNPYLEKLQRQEGTLLATLYENITSQKEYIEHQLKALWIQKVDLRKAQNLLPGKEQQFMNIQRTYDLNNGLYTSLLEKRVEAQIQKASNLPDNEVVESAHFEQMMQLKGMQVFFLGGILGLFFPALFIFLKAFFNNKIESKEDLEAICSVPIIGSIAQSKKDGDVLTQKHPQDPVTESFRALRTRLDYLTKGSAQKTLLITSSISGEGKTFCALNISGIYALAGKKTIILGFDLRRPQLGKYLEIPEHKGISTYLIGKDKLEEVIQNTKYTNLDCIVSGPVPPNPAELIDSYKTKVLFEALSKKYDCIVIDTSPVGMVSDSLLLSPFANASLFVTRHQLTNKSFFSQNMKLLQEAQFKNVGLILNGIKGKSYGYGYGYGYGYESADVVSDEFVEVPTTPVK
ncbi:polysaccharide biosynthesis tyrosine autokinase [Labilibaculum antarcticum]|uniref:Tyrosine protein kinase n=1 Tax=Labilibaculum antarcticum TaxID=1717717 RepID=A0A1Y1CRT4_9BACT|nr:tyrosine-protein kinase family protein [Labilibaculum antarcticum]BAX82642.1 tyrosine protein kinase [Labilibaculum antarcticum]